MVAGVALGSICRQAGTGTIGPACHLYIPLPVSEDICVSVSWSTLEEAVGPVLASML